MTKRNLKSIKIFAGILGVILILALAVAASCFVGDPISKSIIKNRCNNYLKTTYPDKNYVITDDSFHYFFNYEFIVQDTTSIDSRFYVSYDGLNMVYDAQPSLVESLKNTQRRLSDNLTEDFKEILLNNSDFLNYEVYGLYGTPVNETTDHPITGLANFGDKCFLDMVYDKNNIQVPIAITLRYDYMISGFSGSDAVKILKQCNNLLSENGFNVDVFTLIATDVANPTDPNIHHSFTAEQVQKSQLSDANLSKKLDDLQKNYQKY